MAVPSDLYWQLRALKDYASIINKTEQMIHKELAKLYSAASKDIQKDIEAFYQRYADKNGLTLQEAKRIITAADLHNADLTAKTARLKGRITRLQLIQLQVDAHVARLYDEAQENIYEHLYRSYENGFTGAVDIAGKQNTAIAPLNRRAVDNAILQDWSRKNFSDRIWGHREKLESELREILTNGLIKGVGVDKTTQQMSKRLEVKLSDAKRLVRTETNYAFNKGSIDGYMESGLVERYQYLATLDNRTSEICTSLDNHVFLLKDAAPGLNCPPMHPNCRSTTVAYFGDISGKQRRAKADGKSYLVPADSSYKDWYNGLSGTQQAAMEKDLIMRRNENADKAQFKRYKEILGKSAPPSFSKFRDLKYYDSKAFDELKRLYRAENNKARK